jgi:tetratricopeptide (TPR) repeat protein
MLNKGFRIPEVDILFKLRLFIQNLHNIIISSSNNLPIKTIYRSQFVTNDELDILKKCTDGSFISFSHFFLASTKSPEQKLKSLTNENNSEEEVQREEIIFEIDVSNSNNYIMSIDDDQILVTFGLTTRFGNIEKDKNGQIIIHLTTIHNDDRQFERLIEPIRKETRAPHPSLRIVKLFIELEQYSQAVHLGQILLADLPNARKDPLLALARTYHSLGTALYEREEYDQALDVIKKSHELYVRFLPEDAPQLSPTWNNMGSIYLRQGKTDLALEYHEKALSIQLKSPSPDLPSIISYSNNIGGVYLKLERYDEALVHFKRALQIEEQTLPTNHPELAGTYHRIGGVYFRQNNYEKALEYYDKTLQIELASLPDNHPTVAVTYHNRGTAFEGLGKLPEAVESAEKAVERLLKTLPKEHPQVKMNQAYVDKLKQKLWVKQLFTS